MTRPTLAPPAGSTAAPPGAAGVSERGERALRAICDTFAPRLDGVPSASELRVPAAVLANVAANPRAAERARLARLLALWDTRAVTGLCGGGPRRFSALERAERERVLLSWCDSRLPQRRAAFQALRKAALGLAYMLPAPDGTRNPRWDALAYPGPTGPPADPPPAAIAPLAIHGDTDLDCDVCVVGSGAGGGTAAGVLAAAGLDVVVLEAGEHYEAGDFDGGQLCGLARLYEQAGAAATHDHSVALLAGACLGGGTTVNFTSCFRTPDHVRAEWAAHGLPTAGTDYSASLDAVWQRLAVTRAESRPSARDRLLHESCAALGWHAEPMARNVSGCTQDADCGTCGYGCRRDAKRSTVTTWLADAHAAGARILVRTRAERVLITGGSARGVEARTADGHRVTVRARAVIAACGALHTPALLRRSGLANRRIGRHLRLHPATVVWGHFEQEVRPWEGTLQAVYSAEHADLHDGYGVRYETAPTHPSLFAAFLPWRGAGHHAELMRDLAHTSGVGIWLRDRDGGEVRVGRDGEPVARYRLSDFDTAHVRAGFAAATRILEAAGARRIFSSHARWIAYRPGDPSARDGFLAAADACGWGAGRCAFASAHLMGTARHGGSPKTSACDPDGQAWETRGLYVTDGSSFPTATGVNPMVSIEALAHLNAIRLASRLA
jgi:choline dehydrogenase-like flavoprotein